MLITGIVAFIIMILSFLLSMMPDMRVDFSPEAQQSIYSIMEGVNAFVPVTQLGIILGLILAIYAAEFLWLLLNWLIAKIPFIE